MSQKSIKIRPNYTAVFSDVRIEESTPTLKFQDSSATDGESAAEISVSLTDTGTGTEDADMSFSVKIAGTLTEAIKIDADGFIEMNLPVALLTDDFTVKDAGTASLNFKDDDCTDDDINAAIELNCTDTGSTTEDADLSVKVQIAGTLTEVMKIDADGSIEMKLPVLLTGDDLTIKDAGTASLNFKDDDCTDDDINAAIEVNCTDTGSTTEDADITIVQQVAGTSTSAMLLDADGDCEIYKNVTIKHATAPALQFKDDNATDDDINAQIDVNLTDTGTGAEDADIFIKQQIAGTLTTVVTIDADGDVLLGGKNLIVKHATAPALYFKDDDATDDDVNAQINVNLTGTGSAAEDADMSLQVQKAGALTEVVLIDSSASNIALASGWSIGTETTFSATFDNSVGALNVVVRKIGKLVTLEVPAGTTADGGGVTNIASGATDVPAAYRPAADITFPAVIVDNSVKIMGKLIITSAGRMHFYADVVGTGVFDDNLTAGWDRTAVTYTLA